ncbi:MAG: hypothetical protein OXJ90_16860 [Spirochaetaceae bacterium]|nr:hypothetical protein [Spirochaetaceae bacterium]
MGETLPIYSTTFNGSVQVEARIRELFDELWAAEGDRLAYFDEEE